MFPRVTHPSAADALLHPLDLHVLSLPPAFVLSQDQTLKFNLKDPIPTGHVLVKLEDRTLLKRPRLLSTSSKRIRSTPKKRPLPRQPASRPSSRSGAPRKPSAMNSSR